MPRRRRGTIKSAPKPADPHGPDESTSRAEIRAVLTITACWLLLFLPQILAAKAFVIGDTSATRAFAEYSADRWRAHHQRTFWNPYVFGGFPAVAALADSRPQYLPGFALSTFDALHRVPGWPPLALPLLAHLAGMLACAFLARRLWGARAPAMVWAGLAWGLMPNLVVPLTFGHDPQLMAFSLLPVVLLGIHETMAARPERVAWAALLLAIALALEILAAYPQIVLFLAPLAVAFAIERAWSLRSWSRLLVVALAAVGGAALSAAVWWPALLYNRHSVRAAAIGGIAAAEVAEYSLAWRDLLALVWPRAVGFGGASYWGGMRATDFPQYLGVATVVLAAVGFRSRAADGRAATLFAVAGLLGIVVALGTHLPALHAFLSAFIPLWSSFRLPVNGLLATQLAAALLSARGIDAWASASRRARALVFAILGAGLTAAIVLASPFGHAAYEDLVAAARPALTTSAEAIAGRAALDLALRVAIAAGALVGLLWIAPQRNAMAAMLLVAAVLLVDAGGVDFGFLRAATGPLAPLEHPPAPAVAMLAANDTSYRAMALVPALFFGNDWIRWHVRSISGYHPAAPLRWADLRRTGLLGNVAMERALSVRYAAGQIRVANDTTRFTRLPSTGDMQAWEVRGAVPRMHAVTRVTMLASDQQILSALARPEFDPTRLALTSEDGIAGEYGAGASVRWVVDEPDHQEWTVDAPERCFMVVSDAWFEGWRAFMDGVPLPIHRVDHALRGLAIPAGRHRIALDYEPEGWRLSVTITRIALLSWLMGLAIAYAFERMRRRVKAPASA